MEISQLVSNIQKALCYLLDIELLYYSVWKCPHVTLSFCKNFMCTWSSVYL